MQISKRLENLKKEFGVKGMKWGHHRPKGEVHDDHVRKALSGDTTGTIYKGKRVIDAGDFYIKKVPEDSPAIQRDLEYSAGIQQKLAKEIKGIPHIEEREIDGKKVYVEEKMPGKTLADFEPGDLTAEEKKHIHGELVRIQEEMGKAGYMHGDPHARNFLYDKESKRVSIVDFDDVKETSDEVQNILGVTDKALDRIKTDEEVVHFASGPKIYGRNLDKEQNSFDRFNLDKAKRIGAGSDRAAYELPDGKVIKIAKNPRGLAQNDSEGDYAMGLLPETHESGNDYVVVDKVERDDKKSRQMLKPLQDVSPMDWEAKNDKAQNAIHKLDEEYPDAGFSDAFNYDLMWNDFKSGRNWGWDKNGQPKLIDAGSINKQILDKDYTKGSYQQDWNQIVSNRRQAVRQGKSVIKSNIRELYEKICEGRNDFPNITQGQAVQDGRGYRDENPYVPIKVHG